MKDATIPIPDLSLSGVTMPEAPSVSPAPLTGPISDGPKQETPPPNKRRRGKKDPEPPPPPPPEPTPDEIGKLAIALRAAFGVTFAMMAARRGPHWALKPEENEVLAGTWAPALAPFLAKYGQYLGFAVAVLATAGIVQPRLEEDARRAAEEKEKDNAKTDTTGT